MTSDDIMRMAREVNGEPAWGGGVDWCWEELERFAALVAAAQRETIANAIDHQCRIMSDYYEVKWLRELAAAIRARGEE